MTSIATRAFCALLSTIGAAGLVAFANPANNFHPGSHPVKLIAIVAVAPIDPAHRG